MNQEFDILYARDSKGNILQWKAIITNNNGKVDIKFSYGQLGGDQAIRWRRNIQGKNIGKANETNAWEQAIKDVESQVNSKKRKGYVTLLEARENILEASVKAREVVLPKFNILIDNRDPLLKELNMILPEYRTDITGDIKPMKAQQYYRSKANWTAPDGEVWEDRKYYYMKNPYVTKETGAIITKFPCMGQPKINGVRCIIKLVDNDVSIKSKEGLEYDSVNHIKDFFNLNNDIFVCQDTDLALDGELYIHGESLQDISSAVKKFNLNTSRVVFVLFDLAIPNYTNIERWQIIKQHTKPLLDKNLNCPVRVVQSEKISNDAEAQAFADKCISRGFEGAIFRDINAVYKFGARQVNMTKLKRCISHEFKIIDVIPQEKDPTMGNFVCITEHGTTFAVNPKGNEIFRREVLDNRPNYIGKDLTIDFYEWTNDMKPLHVITNSVRDYE